MLGLLSVRVGDFLKVPITFPAFGLRDGPGPKGRLGEARSLVSNGHGLEIDEKACPDERPKKCQTASLWVSLPKTPFGWFSKQNNRDN